jgi:hypothetical protein
VCVDAQAISESQCGNSAPLPCDPRRSAGVIWYARSSRRDEAGRSAVRSDLEPDTALLVKPNSNQAPEISNLGPPERATRQTRNDMTARNFMRLTFYHLPRLARVYAADAPESSRSDHHLLFRCIYPSLLPLLAARAALHFCCFRCRRVLLESCTKCLRCAWFGLFTPKAR